MCRIYNTIGSLTAIKLRLEENNIYDFNSLKAVQNFQSSFETSRKQLIFHHKKLIEEEKELLKVNLKNFDTDIETIRRQEEQKWKDEIDNLRQKLYRAANTNPSNLLCIIAMGFKNWNYKRKIKHKEKEFDSNLKTRIKHLNDIRKNIINRYQFIISNTDEAIKQSVFSPLAELERKKALIDNLNGFIYGAEGENKVVKVLENLSNEYFLINDFSITVSPAIYNRQENDYIKSVQIDHILVAPSGIFLIETKNWSLKSIENLSLRSPVQQIRRNSFVLFKLLNNELGKNHMHLDYHHWGDKKISIKNLIVMTNKKPPEEFQYVKVLNLNELLGYIMYFKPIFSINETLRIAEFILYMNGQKNIYLEK
jgi:hypothetical protein